MSVTDLRKKADRDALLSRREDQLQRIERGDWPEDINERMEFQTADAVRVQELIEADIEYLKDLDRRCDGADVHEIPS